ncbi:hypothetical protein GCM10027444_28170 [Actinopolyspora lacussalsi]
MTGAGSGGLPGPSVFRRVLAPGKSLRTGAGTIPVVLGSAFAVNAPVHVVAAALRHTRTVTGFLGATAERVPEAVGELLLAGDRFPVAVGAGDAADSDDAGGESGGVGTVLRADETGLRLRLDSPAVGGSALLEFRPEERTTGNRSRCEIHLAGDGLPEWLCGRVSACLAAVRELVSEWAPRPVVVGTALVEDGMLLAQQRRYPAHHAGSWELPGGRVEPGEGEPEAVVRECREELATEVVPLGRVGTDIPLSAGSGMSLRVWRARLAAGARPPVPVEHRALRWIELSQLVGLEWLEADRLLLDSLRRIMVAESGKRDPK